jgi:hypothetical protein
MNYFLDITFKKELIVKLGTETGSLVNHLESMHRPHNFNVGDGVTICYWTDRRAATVIKVTSATITVQQDISTRIDKNGVSEIQEYKYKANPKGCTSIFRLTKCGWRNKNKEGLMLGRHSYYDYSF